MTLLPYRTKVRTVQIGLLLVGIGVFEYVTRAGLVGALTLAPPSDIVITLLELLRSGTVLDDFVRSSVSILIAFGAALLTGVTGGWIIWRYNVLQQILDPYLIAWYAMPIFAFYPMLIAIFGTGMTPIILIAYAMGVVAIIINTANGFNEVRSVHRDVGRSMMLSRWEILRYIYVPAAAPYIFTGLKLGFVYSIIGVLASEFILSNAGLGFQIAYSYNNFDTSEMFAVMILVVVLSIVINLTLLRIEDRLYRRSVNQ